MMMVMVMMIIMMMVIMTMVLFASEESYGPQLYKIFPLCAPEAGNSDLKRMQDAVPGIEPGEGRTMAFQV